MIYIGNCIKKQLRVLFGTMKQTDFSMTEDEKRGENASLNSGVRCVVIYDGKFKRKGGEPASFNMHYEGYIKRYLGVFERVTLLARVYDEEDAAAKPVTGAGADFVALPMFSNELNFVLNIPRFIWLFWRTLKRSEDVVMLRIPSLVGIFAALVCWLKGVPFAVEVAGDPAADFSAGTAGRQGLKNRLLRPLHKIAYVWPMRFLCRKAKVSAYVTERQLQVVYPPRLDGFSTHYTTLDLAPEAFADKPRSAVSFEKKRFMLANVAMMQRLIKGQDILLSAVAALRAKGLDVHLTLIGDGAERDLIENLAVEAGVRDYVTFTGLLPSGAAVREVVAGADMFVLPSRQEGLPRAMIEAMALGLPCVGSDVGGVNELIPLEFIVPPNDLAALIACLERHVLDAEGLAEASGVNLVKAEDYAYAKVKARRQACYKKLRELV